MCGFAGFWPSLSASSAAANAAPVLKRMTNAIVHRGPDDTGAWTDANTGVALGFCRLSILDLSPTGHQPMTSASERYVITFNGEIYNFADLREELVAQGATFRGHSDTEILLASIEAWGLQSAIERAAGMFAMAVWDRHEHTLHLVRDRLGEKPLYYGISRGTLLFGSELKSLRAHPDWAGTIDRNALTLFLRHNYVPAPYSIYEGIQKVIPGTIVSFKEGQFTTPSTSAYWSPRDVTARQAANAITLNDQDAIQELDTRLRSVIRTEMVADVPLGAFLSGGVDSSLLVALMQQQSTSPIQTFTIGFHEPGYNEATHAKAVANHIGTDHTELYVTPEEARAVIPKLPFIYDEPFADSSQIPTFLVAQLARRHVTVSLSGEGGDELFGGYNRYFWGQRVWNRLRQIPRPLRSMIGTSLRLLSPSQWDRVIGQMQRLLPARYHVVAPGSKIHKTAGVFGVTDADAMYRALMTHWPDPQRITGTSEPLTALTDPGTAPQLDDVVARMMYFDLVSELPDDILVKVDRATMAVSLESRAPYLHPDIVEFAWRIPLHQKLRNGEGKWILRQLLYRYVPQSLIDRPKMGFGVPIESWLRGPLREWAGDLIAPARLAREGYFEPDIITRYWDEHQRGVRNHSHLLWGVLMFQAWLESLTMEHTSADNSTLAAARTTTAAATPVATQG